MRRRNHILLPTLRYLTLDGLHAHTAMGDCLNDTGDYVPWVGELYVRIPAAISQLALDRNVDFFL
jgi:hypothetical protein